MGKRNVHMQEEISQDPGHAGDRQYAKRYHGITVNRTFYYQLLAQ